MMFSYKAVRSCGRTVRGQLDVSDSAELESCLRDQDLTLVHFKKKLSVSLFTFTKVVPENLVEFCVHMEHLSRAGVPLLESLVEARRAASSQKMHDVLSQIIDRVESGQSLSLALAEHPHYFDHVFVGLIGVGEKTGQLAHIYRELAEHIQWIQDVKTKTWKALRYPLVVTAVMMVVMAVLLTYLVPEMAQFLSAFHQELPASTQMLVSFSEAIVRFGLPVFTSALVLAVGCVIAFQRIPQTRSWFHQHLNRLPVVGDARRQIMLARFTHYLSVLFKNGVDILASLDAAKNVIQDYQLREAVEDMIAEIQNGKRIAQTMENSVYFPPLVIRMVHMGESTGALESTLGHVKDYYERAMEKALDRLVSLIEPVMLAVVGGAFSVGDLCGVFASL